MAPSPQASGVQPGPNTVTVQMRHWDSVVGGDLYTAYLSECNVLATWTAEANVQNTLMHVTGSDYANCKTYLIQHIKAMAPYTVHVIAVSGPDGGTSGWFNDVWYDGIKRAVRDSTALTAQDKARVVWGPGQFNLLKNTTPALRGTFGLLNNGRYGPSHPPPARPASSHSDSSSGSSWGNKAPTSSSRPGSSGSKTGAPAGSRPSSSGGRPSSSGGRAPTTAAPAKKVAAPVARKR